MSTNPPLRFVLSQLCAMERHENVPEVAMQRAPRPRGDTEAIPDLSSFANLHVIAKCHSFP